MSRKILQAFKFKLSELYSDNNVKNVSQAFMSSFAYFIVEQIPLFSGRRDNRKFPSGTVADACSGHLNNGIFIAVFICCALIREIESQAG